MRRDVLAIVASLLGHVVLVTALYAGLDGFRTPPPVRTELLDAVELELEEEKPEELEYDPDESIPDGRIVRAPETDDSRRPEDARFLSDKNTRTKHETVSKLRMIAAAGAARRASAPGNGGTERVDRPGGLPSPLDGVPQGDVGRRSDEGERGPAPRGLPQPRQFEARPSLGALSKAIRGTGLDRYEDVPEGRETALNAVSWRHAPFFNRLARQVEQYWEPGQEFRLHDPTGHIYGFRDRETVVKVILNRDGSVRHLYVVHQSGADFLDDEAVEAIDEAGPFPNPPRGLVDPDDDIIAFNFSFTVHVGEPPVVNVRRYEDGM